MALSSFIDFVDISPAWQSRNELHSALAYSKYSNIHLFNYDRKVFTKFGDLNSVGGCVRDGIERIIICIIFYYIIYYI